MAATTLPALLATGDHASRPAASAVGSGGLYSCTDHALVYQTDGSSWTTWATIGGDVSAHIADTSDAHDASAVSIADAGGYFTGTEVEAVTQELAANASKVTANTQTASYTLVLADAGKAVEMNVGSANNLTIPLDASVAFAVGTLIEVYQMGAGQTTVVATGGVTLRAPNGAKLAAQYASAALRKRATDEWVLSGDTTA